MPTIFKSMPMEIKANGNGNLVFKISTKAPDRDEDVLEPMGCDLTNYRANPVVLFAHDYSSPPIGKSLRESIYPEYIESEVEFAPTAFAQDCKKLCEGGYLNAASVGFNGVEAEPIPESKWGKHYKKWELLEWSVVPVPANAGCLIQTAKSKGLTLEALEKEFPVEEKAEEAKIDKANNPAEEKTGATLSSKNKTMLDEICESMRGCGERLRKFIDTSGMMEDEPEEPPKQQNTELTEIKQALEEIKSQVLSLCEKITVKDANKVEFDLDAIKYVKSSKPLDEPEITPDALRKMIDDKLNTYFKGEN